MSTNETSSQLNIKYQVDSDQILQVMKAEVEKNPTNKIGECFFDLGLPLVNFLSSSGPMVQKILINEMSKFVK